MSSIRRLLLGFSRSALTTAMIFGDGETRCMEGARRLAERVIPGIAFFFLPM